MNQGKYVVSVTDIKPRFQGSRSIHPQSGQSVVTTATRFTGEDLPSLREYDPFTDKGMLEGVVSVSDLIKGDYNQINLFAPWSSVYSFFVHD